MVHRVWFILYEYLGVSDRYYLYDVVWFINTIQQSLISAKIAIMRVWKFNLQYNVCDADLERGLLPNYIYIRTYIYIYI